MFNENVSSFPHEIQWSKKDKGKYEILYFVIPKYYIFTFNRKTKLNNHESKCFKKIFIAENFKQIESLAKELFE